MVLIILRIADCEQAEANVADIEKQDNESNVGKEQSNEQPTDQRGGGDQAGNGEEVGIATEPTGGVGGERLVGSNPKLVKAWEREGKLLALAKEADQDAAEAIQQADRDKAAWPGMPALASHEIYEIYGSPLLQKL